MSKMGKREQDKEKQEKLPLGKRIQREILGWAW